jgi:hypothetical protein
MPKSEAISWKRVAVEGVAVVFSILLAFWIDAWWENRQERADERIVLASLVGELRQFTEQYEGAKHYVTALRESARTLLIASGNPDNSLSDEEIDSLLADATWYLPPNVLPTPELDSLISSGDISLISNFYLRRRLTVLPSALDRLRQASQKSYKFYNDEFMPYLARNASLQQIFNADTGNPADRSSVYPDSSYLAWSNKQSHKHLLDDTEFQSLMAILVGNFDEFLEWNSSGLIERINETVELLDGELAE